MFVIDPGHRYRLDLLDSDNPDVKHDLQFVKREGPKYPGNIGHYLGTNIQEVCRAVIDRLKYLDKQEQCIENDECIENLRDTIFLLEQRAAHRHGRTLCIDLENIELQPTCIKCGHIGCTGKCH